MQPSKRKSTLSLRSKSSFLRSNTVDSASPSLYSLGNNSSGTLMNSISKVEFTNVRPEEERPSKDESNKPNKIKRFIHKVKKELDSESINEKMKPDLTIQTKFIPKHSNEHKSPLARTFSKDEPKVSFSDRLRQLNSTKYKSYNYHNLIKTKRDKTGPKTSDLNANETSEPFPLADTYVKNYTVQELEHLINTHSLSLSDCDDFANDIYKSITQLTVPMFKGEKLKYTLEDMTKLIGIYVKLRLLQEIITETQIAESSVITHSSSSSSIPELIQPPVIMNSQFIASSPVDSHTLISPVIRVQANIFNASSNIKDGFLDLMKHLMTIMINQLYFDDFKQEIKFIRGANPLLTKRRNTLSSFQQQQQQQQHHHTSFSSSVYTPDLTINTGAQSSVDLPIMPSNRSIAASSMSTGLGTMFPTLEQPVNNTISMSMSSFSNLGMLPLGTFERCTSILWQFFETDVLFELIAMFLPIELELSVGHQEVTISRNRANRIKYGSTTQLSGIIPSKSSFMTYTNTTVHPEYFKLNDKSKKSADNNVIIGDVSDMNNDEENDKLGRVGVLGELSDVNIREWILQAYRDFVVIPLYELNRNYEDVDGVIDSFRLKEVSSIDKYYDAFTLQNCFVALSSVDVNDTNQRLIENLLDQMRDRCSQLEEE